MQCGRIVSPDHAETEAKVVPAIAPIRPVPRPMQDVSPVSPVIKATGVLAPGLLADKPAGRILAAALPAGPILTASSVSPQITGWHRRIIPRWVLISVMGLAILAATDGVASWYYQYRVYPGVKVAGHDLGGRPLAVVTPTLAQSLPTDNVQVVIGTTEYRLRPTDLGVAVNTSAMAEKIQRSGRQESLALVGLVRTLFSSTLPLEYEVNEEVLAKTVTRLAAENSHEASDAWPVIVGATPLIIAEKAGQKVEADKLRESLLIAFRNHRRVVVGVTKLSPELTSSAYTADIDDARAKMALSLSIKAKTRIFVPDATEVARWLRFGEPGAGARVEPERVGAYIAGLAGVFDRPAAQAALMNAVQARQSVAYTAATRRNISVKTAVPTSSVQVAYQYCLAGWGVSDADLAELRTQAATVLGQANGWSLGGAIGFRAASNGCHMTLWLASEEGMAAFNPACADQTSCSTGNVLVIRANVWSKVPIGWTGTQSQYRDELINHEIGHWLGFNHAGCSPNAPADSPLSQITLHVAGCAPAWHPIPAELQGLKVLPGF